MLVSIAILLLCYGLTRGITMPPQGYVYILLFVLTLLPPVIAFLVVRDAASTRGGTTMEPIVTVSAMCAIAQAFATVIAMRLSAHHGAYGILVLINFLLYCGVVLLFVITAAVEYRSSLRFLFPN